MSGSPSHLTIRSQRKSCYETCKVETLPSRKNKMASSNTFKHGEECGSQRGKENWRQTEGETPLVRHPQALSKRAASEPGCRSRLAAFRREGAKSPRPPPDASAAARPAQNDTYREGGIGKTQPGTQEGGPGRHEGQPLSHRHRSPSQDKCVLLCCIAVCGPCHILSGRVQRRGGL